VLTLAACNLAAGDLYTYPISTTAVDGTAPLTFKWNTACAMSASIDLYLYEPTSANGLIHVWQGADFAAGQYTAKLQPKWWNDTTTASLQLSIIESGSPSWMTSSPAGPVFQVNYAASAMYTTTTIGGNIQTDTAAAAATQSLDAVFQDVSSTGSSKGIPKGAIAAAVIVPLLVIGVIIAVAVRFWRAREAEKRKRWSQALSTHSGLEWEKGAVPGEPQPATGRPSTQMGRPSTQLYRPTTQFSGRAASIATSSVYAVENNMAGAGAGGGNHYTRPSLGGARSYSENEGSRSSVVMPDGHVRQSRISFADTARPDRRSRLSLADNLRPVIGKLPGASKSVNELVTPARNTHPGSALEDEEEDINISPSQMQGPGAFAEAEMRRVAGGRRTGRKSVISFGGDKNRQSTASALSVDDFRTAASARGSVDELRDMEAVMREYWTPAQADEGVMRRSMMSQQSRGSTLEVPIPSPDHNQIENLDMASPPLPTAPSPIAGSSTVAYGPDQMLAVYAARGKVNGAAPAIIPSTSIGPLSIPKPVATRQNSGMRLLSNLGKKGEDQAAVTGVPAPGDMKSFVHLNNGVVSSSAVEALPLPGPQGAANLTIPGSGTGKRSRMSGGSEGSSYSEDGEVGEAK
jgi:hypothetical protein